MSGDTLIWRGWTGLSWFSLSTHLAGSAAVTASDPNQMTASQVVPVEGRGFLWWSGYDAGGRIPRTGQPLSAGALVTVSQ